MFGLFFVCMYRSITSILCIKPPPGGGLKQGEQDPGLAGLTRASRSGIQEQVCKNKMKFVSLTSIATPHF